MIIINFDAPNAALLNAGGKGSNLARLTRAGFRVPPGFIISTAVYATFVQDNRLQEKISASITGLAADDAQALERASTQIRKAFTAGQVPPEVEVAIQAAFAELISSPVAVRSSATTEDLPDLSFAGQQDTFLNVINEDALMEAVVHCWSSLWTARAIGYRTRNNIDHGGAALAVIVQEMVQSEVSGVLFTANPLTGRLSESVINATFGLGEALVSGQVEPDQYVVDTLTGTIVDRMVGSKALSTRLRASGGVETVEELSETRQALSNGDIQQIVALGQKVHEEYGTPQDIEWAFAEGTLYLLQTRPITSLYPVPEISFDPLIVWLSLGSIQGMVGPMTPLGRDVLQHLAAGAGELFHLKLDPEEAKIFEPAGERLWVRISDLLRHPLGHRIVKPVFGFIEPSAGRILSQLGSEPHLGAGSGKFKLSTMMRLARFGLPVALRLVRNILCPTHVRSRFEAFIEDKLSAVKISVVGNRSSRLTNITSMIRFDVASCFTFVLPQFIPVLGPGMAALNVLKKIAGENQALVLEVMRALPGNVTSEMDLALWKAASEIKADTESLNAFDGAEIEVITPAYLGGGLPPVAQSAITNFMELYGMHGVGEIDMGQVRWREDPSPIMHTIQSYLHIAPESAPDTLFARGVISAEAAIEELATEARRQPQGWLKARLVRAAARRIRLLAGSRESPKFFIIRLMGIARKALLEVGADLVDSGTINDPEDLFFLDLSELESFVREDGYDWKAVIDKRREVYAFELRRRQVPRVLVSDGRAFHEGLGAVTDTDDIIIGSPVSPGVVEGVVRIVLDARGAQLAPGEILVCPGTDPAWTPLLMASSGLVTEVGGLMTHGSVVAREFGIPAVAGVHQATLRLKDGQRIRLDGANGNIVVLEQ